MVGKCRLCLRDPIELRQSHFVPAGIYRILRDENVKNPNPWLLTKTAAFQTSTQMKASLFCHDCEQRLSANGENWVLKHCLRADGSFPLAVILASRPPDVWSSETTTKIYYGSEIREIDVSALSYFAASIFWRGSIHPWNEDGSCPVKLGPFEEPFRKYLMGLTGFPEDCALWIAVREGKEIDRLTYAPVGDRKDGVHIYKFPMPGMGFTLLVSKNLPAAYREKCFVRGSNNPIVVTEILERILLQDAVRQRVGSLRQGSKRSA